MSHVMAKNHRIKGLQRWQVVALAAMHKVAVVTETPTAYHDRRRELRAAKLREKHGIRKMRDTRKPTLIRLS